jgi:hypothetical protein
MSELTFDEATHTYRYNGNVVPGVTTVLKPLTNLDMVPPHVLKAAADFGTAVHKACELDDLGELDLIALDPALVPYLMAWRKFSTEHSAKWVHIEKQVHNKTLGYAGTLDRYGYVDGMSTLLDIKSSIELYPSVGPQLAAYDKALEEPVIHRMAVQLKGDGTYVAKHYTDQTDWPVFCSLLTVRNWCTRHRITPNL